MSDNYQTIGQLVDKLAKENFDKGANPYLATKFALYQVLSGLDSFKVAFSDLVSKVGDSHEC